VSADTGKLRREAAEEQAKEKGCIIVEPKPNELFIDIDRPEDFSYFINQIKRIQLRWPCAWVHRPSPSGTVGRYHVYVAFENREHIEGELKKQGWKP